MNCKVQNSDYEKWYQENVYEKLKNVHVENKKYIILPFKNFKEIEKEAETLHHALAILMRMSCNKNRLDYYPLCLRDKDKQDIPYATIGVYFDDNQLKIYNEVMEEAVLDKNYSLKEGNPNAYEFLKESLNVIGEQIKNV